MDSPVKWGVRWQLGDTWTQRRQNRPQTLRDQTMASLKECSEEVMRASSRERTKTRTDWWRRKSERQREVEQEMEEWADKVGQQLREALTHSSVLSSETSQCFLLWWRTWRRCSLILPQEGNVSRNIKWETLTLTGNLQTISVSVKAMHFHQHHMLWTKHINTQSAWNIKGRLKVTELLSAPWIFCLIELCPSNTTSSQPVQAHKPVSITPN